MKKILSLFLIFVSVNITAFEPIRDLLGITELTERLKNVPTHSKKINYLKDKWGYEIVSNDTILKDPEILDHLFGPIQNSPYISNRSYKKIILLDWGWCARRVGDIYQTRYDKYSDYIYININTHDSSEEIEAFFKQIDQKLPIHKRYKYLASIEQKSSRDLEKKLNKEMELYFDLPYNKADAVLSYHLIQNLKAELEILNLDRIIIRSSKYPNNLSKLDKNKGTRFLYIVLEEYNTIKKLRDFLKTI